MLQASPLGATKAPPLSADDHKQNRMKPLRFAAHWPGDATAKTLSDMLPTEVEPHVIVQTNADDIWVVPHYPATRETVCDIFQRRGVAPFTGSRAGELPAEFLFQGLPVIVDALRKWSQFHGAGANAKSS